jgi:hypothetical protein
MTEELFPSEQVDAASQQGDPVVQPPKKDPYKKKVWGILSSNFEDFKLSEDDFYKKLASDKTYANKVYDVLANSFEDFSKPMDKFIVDINYEEPVKKKDGTQGIGFSPYDFLNVGKPSSRTQLPLVGEYSQVQESKATPKTTPKVEQSSNSALQNVLGFIKSGGKAVQGGGKVGKTTKSAQTAVNQNTREQSAIGRLSKGLVDPVTGTKIDRKTGLPTAYVNELNKKSSIINPVTRDFKGTFVQQLSDLQQPGATDYEASLPSGEKIKMTGVSPIPSEVIKEVVKKQSEDAAINTLNNLYEKRGKKFNKNSLEGQKEIQDYIDKENNGELSKAIGNFDGKPYLVRGRGFFESGIRGVLQSAMDPILYTDINSTFNPSDLAAIK